ncbi:hypothetical protein ANO11243_069950 [Dothideomycetidae sp. 11243]|nr:hypothetical protein ANO11243_069950 [fungal sp. No.11243]
MDGRQLGVIADLQAGGWSTTFLTAQGALYSAGIMNGMGALGRHARTHVAHHTPEKLKYPRGYVHPANRYDSETAIRQFSSGRAHVLGLSDAGRIWSWNDIDDLGLSVKFLNIDLNEGGNSNARSKVKKVVAGWSKSAALIEDVGIVVWDPIKRTPAEAPTEDAMLVLQTAIVPQTAFQRDPTRRQNRQLASSSLQNDPSIGEVLGFILLEFFVVFNTHAGRVFASEIFWDGNRQEFGPLVELHPQASTVDGGHSQSQAQEPFVTDVQGSFRNLAIFTRSGQVLTGTQDHIRSGAAFSSIPALQNTGVISLAFGDHHFLALHKDGYITSYGTESQGCGSLGLGGRHNPEGRLRGIRYAAFGRDGKLVPQAYTTGRRVWFEAEKREWIKFLLSGGRDPQEAVERVRMTQETLVQAEVSEWLEQEGNAWGVRFASPSKSGDSEEAEDQLLPYFALSVTAAGWHSGALVLVNQEAADRIRENCIVRLGEQGTTSPTTSDQTATPTENAESSGITSFLSSVASNIAWFLGLQTAAASNTSNTPPAPAPGAVPTQGARPASADPVNHGAAPDPYSRYKWADDDFPRLELSDGRVMPGTAKLAQWRNGRPEWDLDFTAYS